MLSTKLDCPFFVVVVVELLVNFTDQFGIVSSCFPIQ